jgi:hypothetical protein
LSDRLVPASWNGGSGIYVKHYGCVKCQKRHYEDQDIYEKHIFWQSKHGIDSMPIEQRMEIAANFEMDEP